MKTLQVAALLAGLGQGVLADPTCTHASLITDLSERLIDGRAEMSRFAAANYGTTAIYLLIRYADQEPQALFDRVLNDGARAPRRLGDLRDAYALSQPGGLSAWDATDPDDLAAFVGFQPSARRAFLLADDGVTYLEFARAVYALDDFALVNQFDTLNRFGTQVAFALADQPVARRAAIAKMFEQEGELWTAAAILADLPDRSAITLFVERHADAEAFSEIEPLEMLSYSTIGALDSAVPLQSLAGLSEDSRAFRTQNTVAMQAALAGQPADYSLIYLNQSGRTAEVAEAARGLLDQVEQDLIDPVADPEAAWLALLYGLVADVDRQDMHNTLQSYDWPARSIRWFAGRAVETLDVMMAKDAYGPVARGDSTDLPGPPEAFSGSTDWVMWASVAARLAANDVPSDPATALPVIELSWERGDYPAAIAAAEKMLEHAEAMDFYKDAARRLDALCGPTLTMPGGAIRFGGMPIFRFDTF